MTSGSVFTRGRLRFRPAVLFHVILHILGLTHAQRSNATKIVRTSWYVLLCFGIAAGARSSGRGSSHRSMYCAWQRDCRMDREEICYKLYEGCSLGMCMCDPSSHVRDSHNICRPVKRGGDQCSILDKCPDGMECHRGTCQCYVGEMTLDGDYCLRVNEKLLGQSCSRTEDQCVQKSASGYITDEVYCSDLGFCECTAGLQARANSCHRHSIGQYGCVENHHCDGGSVCVNRYCKCPPGRVPMAGKTKCGRTGAFHGLPVGAPCDEIHEQRYCDQGLVCHSCGTDGSNICVRSRLPPYQSPLYARQGSPSLNPSLTCLLAAIIAYLTLIR